MALSPVAIRIIGAVLLVICGTVVLGISAHVENSIRIFEVTTATYTFNAFVGAFTVVAELAFVVMRLLKVELSVVSVAGELAFAALLWVFWLAAGISTTKLTSEGRSFCKHLDDLFDVPELHDLDKAQLAAAKKVLSSACSEIHAGLAFIWIGFIAITGIVGYLAFIGIKNGRSNMRKTLRHAGHPSDPFEDPSGSYAGRSIGVVGEDPDHKP